MNTTKSADQLEQVYLRLDRLLGLSDTLFTLHAENADHDPLEGTRHQTKAQLFALLDTELRGIRDELGTIEEGIRKGGAA